MSSLKDRQNEQVCFQDSLTRSIFINLHGKYTDSKTYIIVILLIPSHIQVFFHIVFFNRQLRTIDKLSKIGFLIALILTYLGTQVGWSVHPI